MALSTEPAAAFQQLDPFYVELLQQAFPTSKAAIDFCRNLCAQFGFTVKQESSTHRNIYVYCSREGLADSVRNPKSNPKRKRPSKRCDCKWRVVLNESKDTQLWRFRKSNNPEALHHNHPLMRPEEIERGWPKQVHDVICELARQQLSTQEIRLHVQSSFPDITWNERRFYNRLSEERQKIRQHDTMARAHQLTAAWSKVCMAAAGCEELTHYAQTQLMQMLETICSMAQIPVESLADPPALSASDNDNDDNDDPATTTPKGFTVVVIPEHTCLVKVYNQRSMQRKRQAAPAAQQQQQQLPAPPSLPHPATMAPAHHTNYMFYPHAVPMPYYPARDDDMAFPPLDTSSVTSSSPSTMGTPPPTATAMINAAVAADRLMPPPAKRRRSSHPVSYHPPPPPPLAMTQHHHPRLSSSPMPAASIPGSIPSSSLPPPRPSSQPMPVVMSSPQPPRPDDHHHQQQIISCYHTTYW